MPLKYINIMGIKKRRGKSSIKKVAVLSRKLTVQKSDSLNLLAEITKSKTKSYGS